MTTLTLVVTTTSLALAGAMAVALALLIRDNQMREAARVAALVRLAATEAPMWAEEPAYPLLSDLLPPPASEVEIVTPARLWSRSTARLVVAGVLGLILMSAVGIAVFRSKDTAIRNGAAPQAQTTPAPLELLALRHVQEQNGITVSGRVQKPAGAPPSVNLIATVFLFGADGSFINSGRAPIDAHALDAGSKTSFVISIPASSPVARYRVSFRDDSGQSVAHVDKRAGTPIARISEHQP